MGSTCPLCSLPLTAKSLEAHLRYELKLPLAECRLCPQAFCSEDDAPDHFRGDGARHPGLQPRLIQPPVDEAMKKRLRELLRLARGGKDLVQERLCVCGNCSLDCREDGLTRLLSDIPSHRHTPTELGVVPKDASQQPQQWRELSSVSASYPGVSQQAADHQEPTAAALPAYVGDSGADGEAAENISLVTPVTDASQEDGLPVAVEQYLDERMKEPNPESSESEGLVSGGIKSSRSWKARVACLQCGKTADRNSFTNHVRSNHIPGRPFRCLLCPASAKLKGNMAQHQKLEHGRELKRDTYSCSLSQEVVKEWIELCFGQEKNLGYSKFRCGPCGTFHRNQDVKKHIATSHLKKTLHKCKKRDHENQHYAPYNMSTHVMKVHRLPPGPDTIDSSPREKYEPIIMAMIKQLFYK